MQDRSRLQLRMIFQLAWRNLWRNRRRTLVTLSSIALGFGLAVLFIGLNDGGHNSMIRNAIQLGEGHITVQPRGYLEAPANHKYLDDGSRLLDSLTALDIPGSIQPRISLQVLASTASNSIGVALLGIDPDTDERIRTIDKQIIAGSMDALSDPERNIIIGDGLARKLKANLNNKVVLMAGKQGGDSQAELGRVKGIFDSGLDELDNYLIFSHIDFTRNFLEGEGAAVDLSPVTRYAIYLDDPDVSERWQNAISNAVDDSQVQTLSWQQMMPQLVQFIAVDDASNYVFLILILIMVVIGIVNTVLMSVLERTREFGLLRALGLNRSSLLTLVIIETLLLSLLAIIVGWAVGGGIHLWFSNNGLDLSALINGGTAMAGTYMDPVIYTELSLQRVRQLTLIIFTATMITGIYPAIKAARISPVQALRT